jgi:hypothetical protein
MLNLLLRTKLGRVERLESSSDPDCFAKALFARVAGSAAHAALDVRVAYVSRQAGAVRQLLLQERPSTDGAK